MAERANPASSSSPSRREQGARDVGSLAVREEEAEAAAAAGWRFFFFVFHFIAVTAV